MIKKQRHFRGSVLVFSLLALALLLSAALSSAAIVLVGKNSSRATEKSMIAFQIADGASENILWRVYKHTDETLNILASNLYGSASCSDGVISGTLPGGLGSYSVTLRDNSNNKLNCSGSGYSTYAEWRPQLVRLISSGTYSGSTRTIDVGVSP